MILWCEDAVAQGCFVVVAGCDTPCVDIMIFFSLNRQSLVICTLQSAAKYAYGSNVRSARTPVL